MQKHARTGSLCAFHPEVGLTADDQEVTHLVAEPDAPDDLLDPYRALGLSALRA